MVDVEVCACAHFSGRQIACGRAHASSRRFGGSIEFSALLSVNARDGHFMMAGGECTNGGDFHVAHIQAGGLIVERFLLMEGDFTNILPTIF